MPAGEFFLGPLESAVAPGELALEASFPVLGPRAGTAFVEVSRRQGDYAVCGVGALVELDGDGAVVSARTAYLSVAPTPLVLDLTEAGDDFAAAGGAGPRAGRSGARHPRHRGLPAPPRRACSPSGRCVRRTAAAVERSAHG